MERLLFVFFHILVVFFFNLLKMVLVNFSNANLFQPSLVKAKTLIYSMEYFSVFSFFLLKIKNVIATLKSLSVTVCLVFEFLSCKYNRYVIIWVMINAYWGGKFFLGIIFQNGYYLVIFLVIFSHAIYFMCAFFNLKFWVREAILNFILCLNHSLSFYWWKLVIF